MADPRMKELAYDALAISLTRPIDMFQGRGPTQSLLGEDAVSRNLRGPILDNLQPSMTAYEPTMRQRLGTGAQTAMESVGMRRPQARSVSQGIFGGPSSPLPADLGVADFAPILGTAMQTQEAGRLLGRAGQLAEQGEYGQAAMETGMGILGLVPGAAGTVQVARPILRDLSSTPPLGNLRIDQTVPAKPEVASPIEQAKEIIQSTKIATPTTAKTLGRAPKLSDIEPASRESFVKGVPAGQELIVHHNISLEKLNKVRKVGGMPVPSIAISNVDNPLTGFGEISLIGNKSMANPSAKNPVFGFDAYTARAPSITYKVDSKSEKNLTELFSDVKGNVKTTSISDLIDEWEKREFNDLMRAKFLSEKGILPNPSDFEDKYDFSRALGKAADENFPEYRAWVNDFDSRLAPAGVNIQEKIFKGFTPSGNRRYAEVNLENLVKEMKGGAGSEGINYGVGNLRAVATPKFRKLDDIKASREKIIPQEEFAKVKDNISEAYFDLSDRIAKLGNQEGYGYRPEDVLYDIGQAKNVNLLDRFKTGADDQLKADIGIFIRKLQKLPTEYFEIKPQRAVQVSEFDGAIVPVDAPESTINYLKDQGIERIHFYRTPEERKELFKKFGDKMFSATPTVGAGAGGVAAMQEDQSTMQ